MDMLKTGLLVVLSNGTSYKGESPVLQVDKAMLLGLSVRILGSKLPLLALVDGFNVQEIRRLHETGFRTHDVSHIPKDEYALKPIYKPEKGRKFPGSAEHPGGVQGRQDFLSTSVKFLAWNLTQYDALMICDTDVVFRQDPWSYVHRLLRKNEYFSASNEDINRGYRGLNSHMMFIRPNSQVFRIVRDSATSGNFFPYTNGDQDVIESIFSPRDFARLPDHLHTHIAFCACDHIILHYLVCPQQCDELQDCAVLHTADGSTVLTQNKVIAPLGPGMKCPENLEITELSTEKNALATSACWLSRLGVQDQAPHIHFAASGMRNRLRVLLHQHRFRVCSP